MVVATQEHRLTFQKGGSMSVATLYFQGSALGIVVAKHQSLEHDRLQFLYTENPTRLRLHVPRAVVILVLSEMVRRNCPVCYCSSPTSG